MNPAAVHIPSQGSIGFEVFLPSESDAKDLSRVLDRQLGHGTPRTQKNYASKAIELKWLPKGKMPGAKDFAEVVGKWAKGRGYALARDMRAFKEGLAELQGMHRSAKALSERFAASMSENAVISMTRGIKVLERLEAWAKTLPSVLSRADRQGLAPVLVWQDSFLPFFAAYDKTLPDLQAVFTKIEVLWAITKGVDARKRLLAAKDALSEPVGVGSVNYAPNRFEFWPHPTKGEHIAYRVADLKVWAKAFLDWTQDGQRKLRELLDADNS